MGNIVIPANAGVILAYGTGYIAKESYPRECGGDPRIVYLFEIGKWLSPRMRG